MSKHKNAKKKLEDLPIIVTSNKLPFILSKAAGESNNEEDRINHACFNTRIKFHQLTKSYKSTDRFPYTVADLA